MSVDKHLALLKQMCPKHQNSMHNMFICGCRQKVLLGTLFLTSFNFPMRQWKLLLRLILNSSMYKNRKYFYFLTRNKFFRFGRQTPSVVSSLFPLSSSVCKRDSFTGSRPDIWVISLSAEKIIKNHIHVFVYCFYKKQYKTATNEFHCS